MTNQYNKDGKEEGLWIKLMTTVLYKRKKTMLMVSERRV